MAKTQDDLVSAVLSELNRIGAGQTPFAEDIASVVDRLGPIYADLAARRIVGAITPSAVSDAIFPDLVRLVAAHVGPVFGKPTDPTAIVGYETRLRELSRLDTTINPLVLAVLEQLEVYQAGANALDAVAVAKRIPQLLATLAMKQIAYFADAESVPDGAVQDVARYMAASLASPPLLQVMKMAEGELRWFGEMGRPSQPTRADYF
jgi:hypothetical protein